MSPSSRHLPCNSIKVKVNQLQKIIVTDMCLKMDNTDENDRRLSFLVNKQNMLENHGHFPIIPL